MAKTPKRKRVRRKTRPPKERCLRRLVSYAWSRSKRDGHKFNINWTDLCFPDVCPLLGTKLTLIKKSLGLGECTPSIDRIDNSKGYVKGNVWIISFKANLMKNDLTITQWKEFCISSLKTIQKLEGNQKTKHRSK